MLRYHVRVQASAHLQLVCDEDYATSAEGIDQAVKDALRQVPHLLASVLQTQTSLVDTITLEIQFARKYQGKTLYALMDKAESRSLGLFELAGDDDDPMLEIRPERD